MEIRKNSTKDEMARAAAAHGAGLLRQALARQEEVQIVVATGASQFEMLDALVASEGIDWHRVNAFHLDEYVRLPITHPASFRLYLWERFVRRLPAPLRAFHYLDGEADPQAECRRVGEILRRQTVEVAFVGIGENGHLAFNDPPADLDTEEPYIVVDLDEACRRQQLGEGWFPDLDSVPRKALSMSIFQILQSQHIVCTVPDERKAVAVRAAVEGAIGPELPASVLQGHSSTVLFLDTPAASLLTL